MSELNVIKAEMSTGLGWTGSGLWRILLTLYWIRTVNCFINLGHGPDWDWLNGKELRRFCYQKAVFWTLSGLGF